MADREKVIKALELCSADIECTDCPYKEECFSMDCEQYAEPMMRDAIALLKEQEEEIENLKQTCQSMMEGVCLLKEQEAVEPLPQNSNGWVRTIKLWYCGACHSKISRRSSKYCPNCGKPILWEGR